MGRDFGCLRSFFWLRLTAASGLVLGLPIATVARHRGELLEHSVYDGPSARVYTLGRCRWLERSNLTVAVMYLEASNIPVNPDRRQLTALAHELNNPRCTADRIAAILRTWKP
ncbi:fic family toxin-antitoxin system, toxin component [Streptomyces sp. NPDC056462]|uniref:fic family toxin-antitoxin system, toxin component n=1 Tax=Streptomyces sp. NPDC056462 TaxID=3345826 RepID=UPI003686987E